VTLAAAACLALFAADATAQVVVNDGFDSYANQAAFEAAWVPIGSAAPISATLSSTQFVSPSNSAHVAGTAANNQQRNRLTFAETGTASTLNRIVFSFDFYDAAPTAAPYRQFSNLQDTTAPSATGQLVAMGLNNNQTGANSGGQFYMARILGYTVPTTADPDGGPAESVGGAGAFFKLNDFGAGARSLGWHNLKVVIGTDDGLSTDFEFYVDDVLAERVSNVGTAAQIRSYDNITLGSGLSNGSNEAYFDNMSLVVQPVPEPSAFVFGFAAVLGAVTLRRRARRRLSQGAANGSGV
jgi:hypothetical protein